MFQIIKLILILAKDFFGKIFVAEVNFTCHKQAWLLPDFLSQEINQNNLFDKVKKWSKDLKKQHIMLWLEKTQNKRKTKLI